MITKGLLPPDFTLQFGEDRIVTVAKVKYLGIWLDYCQTYQDHLEQIVKTEDTLLTRLRGAAWGIRRRNLMTLFKCAFLPKVGYGIRFWGHIVSTKTNIRKLGTLQRKVLLRLTGAYKDHVNGGLTGTDRGASSGPRA